MSFMEKSDWQELKQISADAAYDEATIRRHASPKRHGGRTIKRNQTFAGGGRYQSPTGRRRRRSAKNRYTVPLFPPPTATIGLLTQKAEAPPELYVRTSLDLYDDAFGHGKKNGMLTRDQVNQLATILALPDQFSPGARSTSSGLGSSDVGSFHASSGFGSNEVSFRSMGSTNRSLTAVSPDSAISLFSSKCSSTPSKIGSLSAKKHLQFTNTDDILLEECYFSDSEAHTRIPSAPQRKPYYSELHLGVHNRETTIDSLSLDKVEKEYRPPTLIRNRAVETKYVTAVFEVFRRGLTEILDDVREEMYRFFDQGLIIVCCEMRWSTPDRYRDIFSEIRMKSDVLRSLRVNNKRVLDTVDERNEKKKSTDYLIFPESVTEELVTKHDGYFGGSYRRYYNGLLPWAHRETAEEHEVWWQLKKRIELDEVIDWPLISGRTKMTVVMLNFICVKMNEL